MANHTRPTAEEIEKNLTENLENLDKPEVPEIEEETPEEVETLEEVVEETPEETEDTPEEETPEEEPVKEKKEDKKPEEKAEESVDYEKRYSDSTREANIIRAKERKLNEAIDKAAALPDPTEEELQKEYPDWDIMDDTQKKLALSVMRSEKKLSFIAEAREEGRNIEQWNDKVSTFIEDPKVLIDNPYLEGKQDEFKVFATKESRRGVPMETLVEAFIGYEASHKKIIKKGSLFPTGGSGMNNKSKPQTDILTVEEGARLQSTNYNLYREKLIAGKIAVE